MTGEQILFGLFLGGGVLMFVLGIPLGYGLVPPNWWYGFRTPSTVRNAHIWYPVNRVTGLWLMAVGPATTLTALIVYQSGLPVSVAAGADAAVVLIGIAGMVVHGMLVLHRIKKSGS